MANKDKFIFDTFIELTSRTVPYGDEDGFVTSMIECGLFPKDIEKDAVGNYFYKIGESRTVFTSHLDTVSVGSVPVTHILDGDIIRTDGKTILGADDKAGATILLYLIKNKIPGLYYFFIGEECGCIGSTAAAKKLDFTEYDRMVSFDRRDVGSVITYQSFSRCCSDEFGNHLASELNKSGLNYKLDDGGIYTDSAEFTGLIPECTNLSVGYYSEHSVRESQNISHLEKLAEACLYVDWENLVTKRTPGEIEYKSYSAYSFPEYTGYTPSATSYPNRNNYYGDDFDDWYGEDFSYNDGIKKKDPKKYIDKGDGKLNNFKEVEGPKPDKLGNYYEALVDKIIDNKLTKSEVETIKEQYLDMTKSNDELFYLYLLSNTID